MWGLYGCVCILLLVLSGCFFMAIWVSGLSQGSLKTLYHKFESCYRLSFFSMPKCFSGIRASVVKSCGDLRVCVCILSSGLPGCFLGDVGEWSKPRVCKTLFHKFESCHRLSIVLSSDVPPRIRAAEKKCNRVHWFSASPGFFLYSTG